MKLKKIIINFIVCLPLISFSQDSISIEEAIQLGLKQNYDILISEKDYEINSINNNWANAGALPQININTVLERNISDQSENPTSVIQSMLKSDAINANINLNWTLFNGLGIRANKEKLNQLESLSEGNVTLVIENTISGIILAYYNCVLQGKRLDLLREVVNLSKDRLLYEKTRNDIGTSSKIDYLQIENSLLSDSSNLIIQQLSYYNSIKNFNLLIGVETERIWHFVSDITHQFQIYDSNLLLEKTLSNNSNIKNQYINIEISNQDIKLAKSIFYPMISFNSGAYYNQSSYDLGDFEYQGYQGKHTGTSINYFANLSLSMRIFDGGKLYSNLKNIKVLREKYSLEIDKIKKEVTNKLLQTLDQYNNSIIVYNINQQAYEISKTNYLLAMEKQNRGILNSFNVRDIEIAYINSGISFFESSYKLKENEISLLQITGGIIQDHLENK